MDQEQVQTQLSNFDGLCDAQFGECGPQAAVAFLAVQLDMHCAASECLLTALQPASCKAVCCSLLQIWTLMPLAALLAVETLAADQRGLIPPVWLGMSVQCGIENPTCSEFARSEIDT